MRCEDKYTQKKYYRCIGEGCAFLRAGNPTLRRFLIHAARCRKLSVALRTQANMWAASGSLGSELGELTLPNDTAQEATLVAGEFSLRL